MCSEDKSPHIERDIQDVWYEPPLDEQFFQMAKFRLNSIQPNGNNSHPKPVKSFPSYIKTAGDLLIFRC